MFKKKYIAVIMVKTSTSYEALKFLEINPEKQSFNYKGKEYIIDISNETYTYRLKKFYFIDIHKEQMILDDGTVIDKEVAKVIITKEHESNPELVDAILSKSIVRQIITTLTDSTFKINFMMVSIGLIIGGLTGYIIGISVAGA